MDQVGPASAPRQPSQLDQVLSKHESHIVRLISLTKSLRGTRNRIFGACPDKPIDPGLMAKAGEVPAGHMSRFSMQQDVAHQVIAELEDLAAGLSNI